MSNEMKFFVYLLESYAMKKGVSGRQVFDLWKSKNLLNFIYEMYELYHVERLENAFDDIDTLIAEGN
ncbi:MAG TPA: hypothetical protein DEQ14_07320 [Treponema sp.]|nr:hypothetical protein [Treponema sp.]